MNALKNNPSEHVATSGGLTQISTLCRANGWQRACMWLAAFAVMLGALGVAQAQTIRRVTSPGKFYVDDKQGAGVVYNYAVYMVSNNTASTIPSAYVALTNLIATNLIRLAETETGIRAIGAMTPGQTKLAAFFLKGPGFTGNSDTLLNTTNETHSINVYNGVPGIGAQLVSSNYSFTNIIFVIEALANKITIITNLNPIAPLGSDVDLVIGGETGTIGGNNSVSFSPGVFGSWRPDAYELVQTIVRFTENPTYTNQLYFDPTISGFTNYSGQAYTNTFSFRAIKVTLTNLPVSPFLFIDSGSGTKHTAVSTLTAGGGSNLIYSAINQVAIVSQTVTPNPINAPGGTVTYSITFSNYAATVSLSEIRDTLPGFPGNVTYIPGSATYNALPISDPSMIGQNLRWALPFTINSNSTATLTFQATAPLPAGLYTNSVTAILGVEQIDTTLVTTDNSPSRSVLTVVPVSDMGVGKTAPATIFSSSNFTYTLSVTNFGPSPNSSFTVTDSLPASVTFISATPPAITNGNLVIWTNLGTFAANASSNLFITVRAPANAAGLTNTATVGGPISDPNSTNNVTPPVITTSVTNRPPVAVNDTTPAVNGVAQVFNPLTNDSDPDGDAFIIQSVSFTGGTVSINSGSTNITFTVTNNSNGSISYTIVDTRGGTSTAVISTTGLNAAPVANSQSIGINEDISTNLVLTATDDGTNLTFAILSGPAKGSLSGFNATSGAVTYTPSANYIGADSFTFTVSDGFLSSTGTVSITVSPINDPPIANNQTFTMPEDTSTNVVLTASDVDSTNLVFAILVGPTNGTLGVLNPNTGVVSFTPNTNFAGNDGFTFTVFDGQLYATGNVFSITINPLNDAPLANNQSVTNNEDTVFPITLTGSDVDGPVTNFVLSTLPANGTLSGTGANMTYTPNTNFNGSDSFTFTVNDGSLTSAVATVSITLLPVNDPPVIVNDIIIVTEDSTNSIPVLVNDSDTEGGQITITSVTTTNGNANVVGTNVVYTPSPNFNGTNTLTYCATDGLVTNCASITVIVTPVNDAPIANNQNVGTPEDTLLNVVVTGSDVDSANLVYSVLVGPLNGTLGALNASSGAVTYLPSTNYVGPDIFTFTVSDGSLLSTGSVSIVVGGINDNPLIVPDIATVNEDSISNTIPVLVNDFDIDGDPMSIVSVTTTNGTAFFSGSNVVYTPSPDFNGTNVMTYCATDGLDTNCATITVTVLPINDAPVANNQSVSTPEDNLLNVVVSGTDIDSANLVYSILTGPANGSLGTLNTSSGAVAYTPSTNYIGADSFTFTVFDGSMLSTGTVSITVSPINDAPVAINQTVTTPEDTSTNLVLTASDVDSSNLVFSVLSGPSNGSLGTLNTNTGAVTYSPSNNFNGADSFTFTVTDGSLLSTGTVAITVTPINDGPLANNQSVSTSEDIALPITLTGSDVDGPVSNFVVGTLPANGTLSGSGANLTYTPNTNYTGSDSFTFTVNDGSLTSLVATVSITVNAVNDAPLANNQSVSTPEDTALPITLTGSDVDGPVSNFVLGTLPANGTLSGSGANLTYTPNTNYNGADSFTFTINDGSLTSAVATVSITVNPINDPPVIVPDIIIVTEDSTNSIPVLVNDSDPDGNPLTITSVTTTNGTAVVSGTNVVYTPSTNLFGTNVMTYCATDGLVTNCATITVIVTPVNDAPLANSQSVSTAEDTALPITLTGSDVDGPVSNFVVGTPPANGTLSGTGANLTYTPNTNFNGSDSFTFTVNDGSLTSAVATVSITVTPVNDVPVANNDSYSFIKNITFNEPAAGVLANDSDVEGPLSTVLVTTTTNGLLTLNANGSFQYTPSTNFVGVDTFTYRASDGTTNSGIATVTLNVLATNSAPVAVADFYNIAEDTQLVVPVSGVLTNDTDVDATPLTAVLVATTTNGTLNLLGNGSFTYTPSTNFVGVDTFTYRADDGSLVSGITTVTITVGAVNDSPVAINQSVTTPEDTSTNLVLTASDVDSSNLVFAVLSGPSNGSLGTLNTNTGAVTYSPSNNFNGTDSFTFTVTDGSLLSTGTVSITVTPINDPPVIIPDIITVTEDSTNTIPVLVNDTDPDGNPLTITSVTTTNGTAVISGTNVVYTPSTNFFGTNVMTYCATDGLVTNCATITVIVTPVNDGPLANSQSVSTSEDIALPITLTGSDVDGPVMNFVVSTPPSNGTLSGSGANLTYTPGLNYNGSDSFTFRVNDGSLTSAVATVSITVTSLNDPPVIVDDIITVTEDSTNTIPVLINDSDPDGSPLTITSVSTTNGNATVVGTNVVYTPSLNFNGTNTLTYCATDGLVTNCASITVIVTPVNDGPLANNQNVGTPEDNLLNVVVTGSDIDSANLVFAILTAPVNGTLGTINPNSGAVTYLPSTNYVGPDMFTFTVSDGSLLSTGTVSITVGGINDNPLIVADIATVVEDSVGNIIPVLVNDSDIDGDPISLVSVNTTNGSAVISGTNVVYTPSANFNGTNVMTYCATDGDQTNCATITVTVLPINDAPVANNQSVSTPEDTLLNVVVSGTDIDSANLTYAILAGPANGALGALGAISGAVAYTPSANYNGADSFTFTVSDGSLLSTGTVSITVNPVNDAPIANNDSFTAQQNITTVFTPSGVLANDTDIENNTLTASIVTTPANGVVALNSNGGFVYTSTNNFIGTDTFTYIANDGTSNSAPATVSILVTPLADVVVTKSGPTNVNPSQTFTYTINVANAGPSSASNVVVIDSLPMNLTFVSASAGGVNSSGTVTWPTLASLAVNASTNFTVTVTAPTNGSFVNIASASATTEDPNLVNNNGSASGSRVQTDVVPIPFGIRIGTNVFNPQTGLFEQTVIVTNTGNATASAIRLLAWNFTTLTNGAPRTNVWLWNYHGIANDGRRYVQYNGGVNPGAWVTFHLEYYAPTRVPFTNSLEAQVTLPVPATTNLSGGVLIDVAFADNRPSDPRFVIEWASIIGRNYTVIYGPTATGPWTAATPTVTATATRTQWYDDGPPKTASEPLIGSRYYRVILNPINN